MKREIHGASSKFEPILPLSYVPIIFIALPKSRACWQSRHQLAWCLSSRMASISIVAGIASEVASYKGKYFERQRAQHSWGNIRGVGEINSEAGNHRRYAQSRWWRRDSEGVARNRSTRRERHQSRRAVSAAAEQKLLAANRPFHREAACAIGNPKHCAWYLIAPVNASNKMTRK